MPDEISTLLKRIGIFSLLVIIFLWIYQDPQRDESGSIVEAGNIDPIELYAGDCYKDNYALETDEVENVYSVDALPCSSPHNNEITNTFPKLVSDNLNANVFEQMSDICYEAILTYLDGSESTLEKDYAAFDAKYGVTILYTQLDDSDEPDQGNNMPSVPFAIVIDSYLRKFGDF